MPIQKLADTTVRTLGATQTLTDPASVIKELLDNALDANATSIAVDISTNTLDVIQVRDTGHGIAPEDRDAVARPHCTSKISDDGDLKTIGGSSLGFRGEALASVAEVSGSLTISTRIEGEQFATSLKINQQGESVGQERASLPIGTTIRINDFIKSLSVRRHQALKNAERSLKKIKQLLQAYALARPHVRLSLRVLKAKNDKGNWMFAPKPGGNAEDAAFKVVGAACASQCIWSVMEARGFSMQAFLPQADAEPGKVSGIGTYLSVDARPVNATRGTFKQLVKIFRDALKAANPALEGIKEPFLYLEIKCPSGSYDANIEPAKDDVLFENPSDVVETVKQLFTAVYPPKEKVVAEPAPVLLRAEVQSASVPDEEDGFTTSLEHPASVSPNGQTPTQRNSRQQPAPIPPSRPGSQGIDLETEPPARPQRSFRPNMYGCDEGDFEMLDDRPATGRTKADFAELRQHRNDVRVNNPWMMAKLNSVRRPDQMTDDGESPLSLPAQDRLNVGSPNRLQRPSLDSEGLGLLTPRQSSPHPSAHGLGKTMRPTGDGCLIGVQSLPAPQLHIALPSSYDAKVENSPSLRRRPEQLPPYDRELTPQVDIPTGTSIHAIPTAKPRVSPKKRPQQGTFTQNLKTPIRDQPQRENAWFDHLQEGTRFHPTAERQHKPRINSGLAAREELGDLLGDRRPSAPPRHNRDIRDFISSVNLLQSDDVSSMIENINYGQRRRARSTDSEIPDVVEGQGENAGHSGSKGLPRTRGFMPAGESAAQDARADVAEDDIVPPPKRLKTKEQRALKEVSGNGTVTDDGDESDYHTTAPSRAPSRRRKTTGGSTSKAQRTKLSRLPLERVPAGQGTHNLVCTFTTSTHQMSCLAGRIDESSSLLSYNEPAVDTCDTFASMSDDTSTITAKLHELLINKVCDREMVQDLGKLVESALASRERDEDEEAEEYVVSPA